MSGLSKEQIGILLQIVNRTQISGADAQKIVEIQTVLNKALTKEEEQ